MWKCLRLSAYEALATQMKAKGHKGKINEERKK